MATLLCGAALACVAPGVAAAGPVQTQSAEAHRFDIPSGPLDGALTRFSEQSGLQLVYDAELVRNRRTGGVRGSRPAEAALAELLGGSGLTWRLLNANTVTLLQDSRRQAGADTRTLGTVLVDGSEADYAGPPLRGTGTAHLGGERGGQDEEADGYRARIATIGSGAPTAIEDIPRTVTVMTQAQIEKENIQTLGEAMRQIPGIAVVEFPTGSITTQASIVSRGYNIETAQIDGGAPRRLSIVGNGLMNLDGYERIEMLRGANGVFVGNDSAGGSLNLVRKRPGAVSMLSVSALAGSWDQYGLNVDASTPSLAGSPVAFRAVASLRDQEEFYDNYSRGDALLYGIADFPLAEGARLELGGQYTRLKERGAYLGPFHYADGPLVDAPYDVNLGWDGSFANIDATEFFGRLYVNLPKEWTFTFGGSLEAKDEDRAAAGGAINVTSDGVDLFSSLQRYLGDRTAQTATVDARLAGRFQTGPLRHNLLVGVDYTEVQAQGSDETYSLGDPLFGIGVSDLVPRPDFDLPVYFTQFYNYNSFDRARGIFVSDAVSWRDKVEVMATFRLDESRNIRNTYDLAPSGEVAILSSAVSDHDPRWQGSYSFAYKPIPNLTAYASYSSGQNLQDEAWSEAGPLDPIRFKNTEVGLKYGSDRWFASLAAYDTERTGVGELIPGTIGQCGPTPQSYCYTEGGTDSSSTGLEAEISGEILPGLRVIGNYAYNESEITGSSLPIVSQAPAHDAKLFVDWTPAFLPRASVQLNLRYRGDVYFSGTQAISDGAGGYSFVQFNYTDPTYVVADIGLDYAINDRLSARLWVENVTDEEYFSTVSQTYNFAGRPRSFQVSLRWRGEGAATRDGRSPTNGMVPFGQLADWYAAIETGPHRMADIEASSPGGRADWTYSTDDGAAALLARVGYHWGPHVRVELEGAQRSTDFDRITGGSTVPEGLCRARDPSAGTPFDCQRADGGVEAWTAMVNGLYDFGPEEARFRPYVGLGLGVMRSTFNAAGKLKGAYSDDIEDFRTFWDPTCATCFYYDLYPVERRVFASANTETTALAAQLLAGVSWSLTERASVDLSYRYLRSELEWDLQNVPSPTIPALGRSSGDYEDHALSLGFRWAFGVR